MRGSTLRKIVLASVLCTLVPAGPAAAVPIVIPLEHEDYVDLNVLGPATAQIISPYNYNDVFTGQVISQAFDLAGGNYLYLYQAENFGPSVLEILAISPFWDLAEAGVVTANEPGGFLAGGLEPLGMTYDPDVPQPNISYNYPSFLAAHVPPGAHTSVLYLISPSAPTLGEAYVIDSGTAIVDVVVTIPEPSAIGLLVIGTVMAALRRRRRVRA